mmetsp:Transcript_11713/g.11630  ORF Transcript_11713/g.11630 Transcript_11713/m.11630 type:complete len:130 (+) Transcript_11713:38-427(+)
MGDNALGNCCYIYCQVCLLLGTIFFAILFAMCFNENEFFLYGKAQGVDFQKDTMYQTFATACVFLFSFVGLIIVGKIMGKKERIQKRTEPASSSTSRKPYDSYFEDDHEFKDQLLPKEGVEWAGQSSRS